MADKLHLCLGRRDDINIKSLAEIFFPSKNRARKFAMRRASKILMPAFLRLQNAQIADQLRRSACARRYMAIFYVYCITKFNPH